MLSFYILFLIPSFLIHPHKLFSMQLGPGTASLACARLIVPFAPFIALTYLSLLLSLRVLLEGKSVGNLIWSAWASVYEAYVAVVTATLLLLKLDARVHD